LALLESKDNQFPLLPYYLRSNLCTHMAEATTNMIKSQAASVANLLSL